MELKELITAIHASGRQTVIAITGGGSGAIGRLLRVPGGSRTVLEASVPYSSTALVDYLGGVPDQFCSECTARAMAMAGWVRARRLTADADPYTLIGIGATASLVSDKPKKGEHRIHIGVQTAVATKTYSLTLTKGLRTRKPEEKLAAKMIVAALAEASGVDAAEAFAQLDGKLEGAETIEHHIRLAETAWTRLLLGEVPYVGCDTQAAPQVVFPGAFNPMHHGHVGMANIATTKVGADTMYELSIANVDKPPLDFVEIADRLQAMREVDPERAVMLTTAPTFREKAALVPGAVFVVGADTLVRIADPKYYEGDEARRDAAIAEIGRAGCRFLVFGRQLDGRFCCLRELVLPESLRMICEEVSEGEFHEDVSSTKVRREE